MITEPTAATSVTASTTERIDQFIDRHFKAVDSPDFMALKDHAHQAAKHGFTGSANVRYVQFLEAFNSQPSLSAHYEATNPACRFLPWAAFHHVRKSLKLWCDLPANYAGAVPGEQLPWLDLFELHEHDKAGPNDACALMELEGVHQRAFQAALNFYQPRHELYNPDGPSNRDAWLASAIHKETGGKLKPLFHQFQASYFVMAPPEAFTVTEDFITRFRRAFDETKRSTIPPNDPLVVRFCRGGCLIVAAWGDEAAAINELAKGVGV